MKAGDSYKKRFSSESLKELYLSRVGVRPTVGLDKITGDAFSQGLQENIEIIQRKIGAKTYCFTNYRQMLMLKGKDSKPRELCIPTIRDKLALAALSCVFDDVYEQKACSPMPHSIVDQVIKKIESDEYDTFAKFDIEKFYASIDHEKLMRVLRRKIRKREVLHLVQSAISTPSAPNGVKVRQRRDRGVPEGLSVSGRLANLYAEDIDNAVSNIPGIAYFRYVDDILVLCKSADLVEVERAISTQVHRLGLKLNEKKTSKGSLREQSFGYLGYLFRSDGIVSVRSKSVRNIERALDGLISSRDTYEREQLWLWRLNLRITGCRITVDGESYERYGWIHYFSRITDMQLLRQLDWLMTKLFERRGVPKPEALRSFVRAYYENRYRADSTRYIPSWDTNMDVQEMRRMMEEIFGVLNLADVDDDTVKILFNEKIRREAKRLERDVGLIS